MSITVPKINTFDSFFKRSGLSVLSTFQPQNINRFNISQVAALNSASVDGKSKNEKKKIFGIIGASVGSVALLTLITLFTLSKGFSSGFAKKFTKISKSIKQIIDELSSKSYNLTFSQKVVLKITKKLQPIAESMEAGANITAIKDSAVNKLLQKAKLGKFVKLINKFFKDKIVLTTKNNAYKKAEISVVELCNYLEKIAKKEHNSDFSQMSDDIMRAYLTKFSVKSHVCRTNENWEKMNDLSDKVFENIFRYRGSIKEKSKQFIKNVKNMRTYITTAVTAEQRLILKDELGEAQNTVVDIMKSALKMVPEKNFKKAQKLFNKADYCLSRAIASEIKSFNKLAEIQVGSVATDIIGIIAPTALATALVIKSENKNERIGATLTKGMPIIGGLGVSYYGSTRGFTGVRNLSLGLFTAWLLNIIGTKANDGYKKYSEKQVLLTKAYDAWNKLQSTKEH